MKQLPENMKEDVNKMKEAKIDYNIVDVIYHYCPHHYGLIDHHRDEIEGTNRCLVCWEQALDEIEVN